MPYLFLQKTESPEAGVKRLLTQEMSDVVHRMQDFNNPNLDIHESRKDLKKTRALLRLVRQEVGEEAFNAANIRFRDAGRVLSEVRDAWVLYETLHMLGMRFQVLLAGEHFNEVAQYLRDRHSLKMQHFIENNSKDEIAEMVNSYQQAIEDLPISSEDFKAFHGGLETVYIDGRAAAAFARTIPTTHNLHEWRKQVKYLYYQLSYMSHLWPNELTAFENSLEQLGNLLGEEHDLAVLQEILSNTPEVQPYPHVLDLLHNLAFRERLRLQDQLWPLADRVYEEKSEVFMKRLTGFWVAMRLEVED